VSGSQPGTLALVAGELALAFQPLGATFTDQQQFQRLMRELGWSVSDLPSNLSAILKLLEDLEQARQTLSGSPDPASLTALLGHLRDLPDALHALSAPPGIAAADLTQFAEELAERLVEYLILRYLSLRVPTLYHALRLIGVIQSEVHPKTTTRPGFVRSYFDADPLRNAIRHPESIPQTIFSWGSDLFWAEGLLQILREVLVAMHVTTTVQPGDETVGDALLVTPAKSPIGKQLEIVLMRAMVAGVPTAVAIDLYDLPAESGKSPGLVISPVLPQSGSLSYSIRDDLTLTAKSATNLFFGVVIRPGELTARYPFKTAADTPSAELQLELDYSPSSSSLLVGDPSSSRVQVSGASTRVLIDDDAGNLELRFEAEANGLTAVLSAGDQDGFLAKLLGGTDLSIPIPLKLGWSSVSGFNFSAGAGFLVRSTPHWSLGPITVDELDLSLQSTADTSRPLDLQAQATANLQASLGPIRATVGGTGVHLNLVFEKGNAGPFDIDVDFTPPSGMGLTIDASAVSGTGYLSFGDGKYTGAVQLEIAGITVSAVGVIETKKPDGSPGFSFLILISAQFSPDLPLGMGFTLRGVGGLGGVHRTIALDPLKAAVWGHNFDQLLFPDFKTIDPATLISDLETYFPDADNRYVFGPIAKLGWGTPTIVDAEVGLILSLPDPVALLLIGQVNSSFPSQKPAVELHINFDGGIDFGQKQLWFDASLHDSRIEAYPISGDISLRHAWGDNPSFALAVGGFNPHFTPPPGFPSLKPVSISIGDMPRLTLKAYLAITSNTFQIGASAQLEADAGGFSVEGALSFDALFIFSPFSFEIDLSAGVALKHGGTTLASVHLSGSLAGPTPWKISGDASISLWLFDVSVHFEKTWGQSNTQTLPGADPKQAAILALCDPTSWGSALPAYVYPVITVATAPAGTVLLDPAGAIVVRQKVVPLARSIARFGATALPSPVELDLSTATVNGLKPSSSGAATEEFAPAQFLELSDADKLSLPSFEPMTSGVSIGDDETLAGPSAFHTISYVTIIDDAQAAPQPLPLARQQTLAGNSAAASAPLRRSALRRFGQAPGTQSRVTIEPETFAVASTQSLHATVTGLSKSAALQQRNAQSPAERSQLQVVLASEAA
jgi:hypothetical protein